MKITIVRMTAREYAQQRAAEREEREARALLIRLAIGFALYLFLRSRAVRRLRYQWYRWFGRK